MTDINFRYSSVTISEAAAAIAFLGSPGASYITGAHLEVSGGLSRHI